MGSQGAACFHTLNDHSRDIPKNRWDDERFGMICTKAENIADQKKWLSQLCEAGKNCKYLVDQFFDNVDTFKASLHNNKKENFK